MSKDFQLQVENVKVALSSIRTQLLRAVLTMMIIAIGICALVGILTSIDGIKSSLTSQFQSMGANTFTIRNRGQKINIGKRGKKPKRYRKITYKEAMRFKEEFDFTDAISISTRASGAATLKFGSEKTQPNISVMGCDAEYFDCSGYDFVYGRNFSDTEERYGRPVIVISNKIAEVLFPTSNDATGKIISVGATKYTVIGVLRDKGSSMSFGGDKICMIPLTNVRQHYLRRNASFTLSVMANSVPEMENAISEATGTFRVIRQVEAKHETNFEIIRSDSVSRMFLENAYIVEVTGIIIALLALIGASVGLMNIMLVSVTERTREIGVRKALGATKDFIRQQFLIEAIVICQLGGLLGIILGIGIGNAVSIFIGGGFIIPWAWIMIAVVVCIVVGLISGLYPAIKASKLDPIESLRFE
jgi:putative ABC transport system permease protein